MQWLAFWLYASLSAAAMAAAVTLTRVSAATAVFGFAAGSALALEWPDTAAAAILIGLALGLVLWRPLAAWQRSGLAGVTAGFAGVVMSAQGLALPMAAALALAIPAMACWFATREPRFAPAAVIDQALCALLIAAPAIAAWTQVSSGWQSALNLNRAGVATVSSAIPSWILATLAAAAVAGVIRQQWTRR